MFLDLSAVDLAGSPRNVRVNEIPDQCPICHRSVHPKHVWQSYLAERSLCQVAFRCTHQMCQELFIGTYLYTGSEAGREAFQLSQVSPHVAREIAFSETIESVSPTFIEIYNQALSAEAHELHQLVGIGMRKALEFLVKDFACNQNQGKEQEIRAMLLGACISAYMSDPNLKECAKRAAWLGNDEVHYTRKWESKDINDLKLLVRLTVNWVENVLLTQKYVSEMGDGKS